MIDIPDGKVWLPPSPGVIRPATQDVLRYGGPNYAMPVPGFPVVAKSRDTTTAVFSIVADADDGFIFKTWTSTGDIVMNLFTSTFRFQNVAVSQGSNITSAIFSVPRASGDEGDTDGTGSVMTGDDVDDSPALSDTHNRSSGWTATTASTTFGYPAGPVTADVTGIVQEIVNRAGWSSGNALSLGEEAGSGNDVIVENQGATLTIEWVV